ncbi:(2Fe-2S)-binding protein [Candidatus Formimonas warabiya]|uniref:(2Fe-2S)-binding protein n=1 Tax=Formimonas warabiya TaxID=1761012 RepID=A0A3G1KM81_FORW1|nr:(2Fe-2S)-binding protein [Candidatus Formimonas warabiya]ATW23548.1 (2Fe-2S)-binding protein [Candidatus Formimonas warabiya]
MINDKRKLLKITVNGEERTDMIDGDMTLLDYLRDYLGLFGTKRSCNCGECGSCTVLMDGRAIYSCVTLALQAYGKTVLTIEGLAAPGEVHPIQAAFIESGAVHCGFCTPGFIMSTKALLDRKHYPGDDEIKEALAGNLCRCTGYVQIINAVKLASKKLYG